MIERTPILIAAVAAALTLSACGDRTAASGGAGGPRLASEEPIDAVPLPLDVNPLPPQPVAPPVVATAAAAAEVETTEAVATSEAPGVAKAPEATVPVIRVAPPPAAVPRRPARTIDRPNPTPEPDPSAERPSDRPVLTF